MKTIVLGLVVSLGIAALAIGQRHALMLALYASGTRPALLDPSDEGAGVRWHDDYFTVQAFDAETFAIGEPRYLQQNYNYLIVGGTRAVLFDAGPGIRDIRPVAAALTDRPITLVPSHFHYDHIGNDITFDRIAVVDLPHLRARAPNDRLALTSAEHLGTAEGLKPPTLAISEWLAPESMIELGGRTLRVLYTPGHTSDSISLFDAARSYLFCSDFVYPGELYAFLPNSRLGDYAESADRVLASIPRGVRIFPAHRIEPPGAPELTLDDVEDLRVALARIRARELDGEGLYPVRYRVNARMDLLAEPRWLQDWAPSQP